MNSSIDSRDLLWRPDTPQLALDTPVDSLHLEIACCRMITSGRCMLARLGSGAWDRRLWMCLSACHLKSRCQANNLEATCKVKCLSLGIITSSHACFGLGLRKPPAEL